MENGGCHHTCVNTPGGVNCRSTFPFASLDVWNWNWISSSDSTCLLLYWSLPSHFAHLRARMSQHQVQCYHPVSSCSMEICFCWHKWRSSVCTNTTRVHCGQDSQYCIGQLNNIPNRLHCLNCTACTAVADRRMSLNLGRSRRRRHTVTDIPHQNCCCLACMALHVHPTAVHCRDDSQCTRLSSI